MTAALLPAPDDDAATRAPRGVHEAGATRVGATRPTRRPYLVPVPDCEPPFDDEVGRCPHHGRTDCGTEPAVPRFEVRHGSWHAPGRSASGGGWPGRVADLSALPVPGQHGAMLVAAAPRTTVRPAAPAPPAVGSADHSARLLARALIEVLAGHRPLPQLRAFCTPQILAALDRRGRHPTPALPHVLSVRVCEPADGVAEVAAVFRRGDRVRMVAFRLERLADPTGPAGGRWTITAVQPG